MPDYPIDIIETPDDLPINYSQWKDFELLLFREFAKDLARHDAKIENEILNFIYKQLDQVTSNLLAPINKAAMDAHDSLSAINEVKKSLDSILDNGIGDIDNQLSGITNKLRDLHGEILNNNLRTDIALDYAQNNIIDHTTSNLNSMQNALNTSLSDLGNNIEDTAKKMQTDLHNDIVNYTGNIVTQLGSNMQIMSSAIRELNNNTKSMIDNQTVILSTAVNNLTTEVLKPNTDFKDALDYIWDKIKVWLESNVALDPYKVITDINNLIAVQKTIAQHYNNS